MIGRKAEEVLNRAVRYAFDRHHEYFTLEHVLLSLLEEPEILEIIRACGASYTELKIDLEHYLDNEVPELKKVVEPSETTDSEDNDGEPPLEHPVATLSIQRLIQRALFQVQSSGRDEIKPVDLFVALFQSKDSQAYHLLAKQKIERLDVLNFISHGVGRDGGTTPDSETADSIGESQRIVAANSDDKKIKSREILEQYTVHLNALALKGKIDPVIGRESEIERIVQTLCRRRKNNVILVGEAGVGKTAIVEGLALRIVSGKIPHILKNVHLYSLDVGSLLAGTRFRGDFEQRLKKILKALQDTAVEGVKSVLFIDEIHTMIGAGAVGGGALDAANLLKPMLSRGDFQCIGSTTYQEYRNVFEKDHAFARRFQKIDVAEPSVEESIQILTGLKQKFEAHHHVTYSPEVIKAAVDLSVRHMVDRFLPDKAIDLLDEVGARVRVKATDLEPGKDPTEIEIKVSDIEELVAKVARIPEKNVSTQQRSRLKLLDRDLKLAIFGQDLAIDAVVSAIRLSRSGLRSPDKPIGNFLFCGPTGVGKTELSKQLAHALGVPFLRFDMSEYMEKHTVSRLIGAPPGYVGFEQAGLLTDAVLKNPHSVILLDEIEKAHPDLMNVLLQIMDYGFLTDNNGRKADFRNALIIMTSNVGTREHDRRGVGFSGNSAQRTVSPQEVERAFSPEFRNRLDSIVYFDRLDPVTIAQVVGKQLMELESQLLAKQVEIDIESDVREWLAHKGYDPSMGARPLARLIQDKLKKPLSEQILFGDLEFGGKVRVFMKTEDEVGFEYKKGRKKPPRSSESKSEVISGSQKGN